jgi:hypothetical protein
MIRLWLVIFLFLSGCHTGQQKRVKDNLKDFSTTDASVLFFKNLRIPYYEPVENRNSSILTFILKDRYSGKDRIVFKPFINIHRYDDRASITLKINRDILADTDYWIEWKSVPTGKQGRITFDWTKKDHTRSAIEIYNHLISGTDFILHIGNNKADILQNRDDRESFRITLVDFLRLIDSY